VSYIDPTAKARNPLLSPVPHNLRCKAEMLGPVYDAHLKQSVILYDPVTGTRNPVRCKDYVAQAPPVSADFCGLQAWRGADLTCCFVAVHQAAGLRQQAGDCRVGSTAMCSSLVESRLSRCTWQASKHTSC
jgi:hypothetical protein